MQKDEEEKLGILQYYLNTEREGSTGTLYGISATIGNGTENNPYIITNADQLLALSNLVNGGRNFQGVWFALGDDIQLDQTKNWLPIGTEKNKFKGNFNGNNHYIKGLYFNDTSAMYVGLFGYTEQSIIRNIKISSENSILMGYGCVGSIVGRMNNGIIENCINETSIQGVTDSIRRNCWIYTRRLYN